MPEYDRKASIMTRRYPTGGCCAMRAVGGGGKNNFVEGQGLRSI